MHHVDRVMRQLGADQPILGDPVNVDAFLMTTGRGEDVWWPTHPTTRAWYESWMRHATDPVIIQIVPEPDFRGNREYFDWWDRACKSRFLSDDDLLHDPRVLALPPDIHPTPSQPPPDIPLSLDLPAPKHRRGGRAGDTGGPVRRTQTTQGEASTSHAAPSTSQAGASRQRKTVHRERYDDESEEERLVDQFESFSDSPVRHLPSHPPPPPWPADQQTQPEVVHELAEATWEELTSVRLDEVWDVTRTSASATHNIAQGFRQRADHARGSGGVDATHPSMQFHTPARHPHLQHFPSTSSTLTTRMISLARATHLSLRLDTNTTHSLSLNYIALHLHINSITLPRPSDATPFPITAARHSGCCSAIATCTAPAYSPASVFRIVRINKFDPRLVVRADTYSNSVGVNDFVF
ncbi:hypothetical protein PIB30_051647 [Stylosanthes scabra]|uniref:Uncharacterized protein n=1 Tax=Stylosanthes scabra TaxID=79078 RepID=A0ABU6VH81_9FABA|nr:hypothetical protein [Stylosanthes scabra]